MSSPEPDPDPPTGHGSLAGFAALRGWLYDVVAPRILAIRAAVVDLQASAVSATGVRLSLPSTAAAGSREVAVTWPQEMPSVNYVVLASFEVDAALLGRIFAAVKPNTRTTTGCTLVLAATVAIPADAGSVAVLAFTR